MSNQGNSQVERLKTIVDRLRGPDGCPWDQEQTHLSLRRELLEECHEVLEAIDSGSTEELREELGDLLLQVVMHCRIASEEGRFDLEAVASGIAGKLIRRHPHVFGETKVSDTAAVLRNWDRIKADEKPERRSRLDGVPKALPALARAQKIQVKAARAGFDWPDSTGVAAKVSEEWMELKEALEQGRKEEVREEFGDLLFSMVNLARSHGLEAEAELAAATRKFERRFRSMETASDTPLEELDPTALDQLWEAAKKLEKPSDQNARSDV